MRDDLKRKPIADCDWVGRAEDRFGEKPDQDPPEAISGFRPAADGQFTIEDMGIPLYMMSQPFEPLRMEDIGIPLATTDRSSESIRIEDVGIPLWTVPQHLDVYSNATFLR